MTSTNLTMENLLKVIENLNLTKFEIEVIKIIARTELFNGYPPIFIEDIINLLVRNEIITKRDLRYVKEAIDSLLEKELVCVSIEPNGEYVYHLDDNITNEVECYII